MGLISKFLGHKLVLTSVVTFRGSVSHSVVFESIGHEKANNLSYITLVLLHYAKIMAIIPKNYNNINSFLHKLNEIVSSADFKKRIFLDFDSQFFLKNDDTVFNLKSKERKFVTELFKSAINDWYVKTKIPFNGPTSQALQSIAELMKYLILNHLTESEIVIMKDAINAMTIEYLNGTNYRSVVKSTAIPLSCLEMAIKKNI